jgi:hypothetical protein
MLRTIAWSAAALALGLALANAAEPQAAYLLASPGVARLPAPPDAATELAALRRLAATRPADLATRLRRWEAGGPVHAWGEVAVADMIDRFTLVAAGTRNLALLHAALHDATLAVTQARAQHRRTAPGGLDAALPLAGARPVVHSYPSEVAAVSEAAARILAELMPDRAEAYHALADQAVALRQHAGLEFASDAAAGRAIGARIAVRALERGRNDRSDIRWTGSVPQGPGRWQGATPYAPLYGTWKPFLLPAADALRPPAPPAVDSAQVAAAIAELKAWPRAPKANHDAVYWEVYGGARVHQLYNMEVARQVLALDLAVEPLRVAAAYAAVNIALYDAGIACWDAKYAFWYPRPHMVDEGVRTLFPAPGHPSYPSAHSCFSGAATGVLAGLFPDEAPRFAGMLQAAGMARLVAGIHFRFDIDAGEAMGRGVAALALKRFAPAQ